MALVDKENIINYIPQRHPFIMVDSLTNIEDNTITTKVIIRDENIFVVNGTISFYGILEHIAQSVALGYGYMNENCFGVIGKISNCLCSLKPLTNIDIVSNIIIEKILEKSVLISAKCFQDGNRVLSCNMYLYFT